jgi:hypothetical protein
MGVLSEECLACHVDIASSTSVANPYLAPPSSASNCGDCHGTNPPQRRGTPASAASTEERWDFPHDAHVSSLHPTLAQGCYSCHDFAADPGTQGLKPITRPESMDCMSCHDATHSALGGGSCRICHTADDPVYRLQLTDSAWPYRRERAQFGHFSEGHVGEMSKDCLECHDGVQGAQTIQAIPAALGESARQCRQCHDERRFHRTR